MGAGAITGKSAIPHRKHTLVNLLLVHQQANQRFVDDRVRPVPALIQQTAEGIFHRTSSGGENVRLEL